MRHHHVIDLSEVREIRQILLARPPAVVHGTLFVVLGLLATGLAWSYWAQVDEVVEARGRIRAAAEASMASGGDDHAAGTAAAQVGGRVVEVCFREGDRVQAGQVLARLETTAIDAELARVESQLANDRLDLTKLQRMHGLIGQQHLAARAKALAEFEATEEELQHARQRRERKIRQSRAAFERVDSEAKRALKLWRSGVIARQELDQRAEERQGAWDALKEAKLPLDERREVVARRNLEMVEQDYALRTQEMEIKLGAQRGELEAAEVALAKLQRDRDHCEVRAPNAGIALAGDEVRVGGVVQSGTAVARVASEGGGYLLQVALSSVDVGLVKEGMPVKVRLDAFDHQKYGTLEGELVSISADSQFTEQGQVLYVAKVRLAADHVQRGELVGQVRLGMGASAQVVTGRERILGLAFRGLMDKLDWTQRAKA